MTRHAYIINNNYWYNVKHTIYIFTWWRITQSVLYIIHNNYDIMDIHMRQPTFVFHIWFYVIRSHIFVTFRSYFRLKLHMIFVIKTDKKSWTIVTKFTDMSKISCHVIKYIKVKKTCSGKVSIYAKYTCTTHN